MVVQNIYVNLIPDSEPVIVHVNQYDFGTGRFLIHLLDGDNDYTPASGATVRIEGEKPDGNVFSYDATLSGSIVTADVKQQMTAVEGRTLTQILVFENNTRVGTFNFWMDVQKAPIGEDSPVSETEIPAIIAGAEAQAQRAEAAAVTAVEASSEAETSKTESAASAASALASASSASQSESDAEAWARGTRGGTDVPSTDETYHNNSMYYSGMSGSFMHVAGESATAAATSESNSEAWAEGTRGGEPVGPSDPAYHKSAKYWAEQAGSIVDIHPMDNNTMGIGIPDGETTEATEGTFSAIGTTVLGFVDPTATEYSASWLLDSDGNTIVPEARRQYRVTIRGKAVLYYWNGTAYAPLGSSGHTIEKRVNGSIVPMAGMDNLLFDGVGVENDELNNRTIIKPQFHVCATEAEWNQMTDAEKNDPLVYWVRPWANSDAFATDRTPVGTVISVAGSYNYTTHTPTGRFPSNDYLVCNGATIVDGKNVSKQTFPKLAEYFQEAYGNFQYFGTGGGGTDEFSLPNWELDFPEDNGILCIKAQISSTVITYAEVDQSGIYAGEDKVPSCARVAEIEKGRGIKINNLGSITTPGGSYTATEDCWATGFMSNGTAGNNAQISISGAVVFQAYSSTQNTLTPVCFPVKKGQTVSTRNYTGQEYQIIFRSLYN